MARLRNRVTGVVVEVSDDLAATLGSGWEADRAPAEKKPAARRAPKRDAAASADDE